MNDQNNKKVVGIDLGTTFSCIATIDEHNKPEVQLNEDNRPLTASAVFFDDDSIVVGDLARDNAISSPNDVVMLIKREMGTAITIPIGDKAYVPEEISAMILKKLKQDAERSLNHTVTDAIITVPAYFGAAERKATQDAGEMAGLNVLQTLDEPVAAALAFGFSHPQEEQTLLVYDLGGGTFDITLFKIGPADSGDLPKIEMISTQGNHRLGGADWDKKIVDYVSAEFVNEHGEELDPRDDAGAWQDLQQRCEKAKIALARVKKTKISCQCSGKLSVVELDCAKLKELTETLLNLTEEEIDALLLATKYTPDQIDQVLCVGGSTRLLMVREMLNRKFPGKVNTQIDADQCVAQGAAIMGELISKTVPGENNASDTTGKVLPLGPVTITTSHGYGVEAQDSSGKSVIYPLILKDETVPYHSSEVDDTQNKNYALGQFYTAAANQSMVKIPVYEVDARSYDELLDPDACRKIGEVMFALPSGRPAGQTIYVTFRYNSNLQLSVTAVDVASGKEEEGELDTGSNMHQQQKSEMTERLARQQVQS